MGTGLLRVLLRDCWVFSAHMSICCCEIPCGVVSFREAFGSGSAGIRSNRNKHRWNGFSEFCGGTTALVNNFWILQKFSGMTSRVHTCMAHKYFVYIQVTQLKSADARLFTTEKEQAEFCSRFLTPSPKGAYPHLLMGVAAIVKLHCGHTCRRKVYADVRFQATREVESPLGC
jgi:hypothetical protein